MSAGSGKLLSKLQAFKVKYAEARAQERPDLREVYDKKIKMLKEAGKTVEAMAFQ